jgi:basic membrane protein A
VGEARPRLNPTPGRLRPSSPEELNMGGHHRYIRLVAGLMAAGTVAAACGSSAKTSSSNTTAASAKASTTAAATTGTTAAGGGGTTAAGKDYKWMMVTDQAGLGDKGFNDLAYAGIQKAAQQLGGTAKAIESSEQAQYVPNLQQTVSDKAALTVGVGFLITDAMSQVASANPNAKFVLIDAVAADKAGTPLTNVRSVTFKEQEGAYLVGIIAGMTTKTNKIGFVGGLEIPPVVRFLTGFKAGLASVNPSATVQTAYVGNFQDPAKGKELATNYFDTGSDIVFEVAGLGGTGAYEAAKAKGKGFWVIGTDTCKDQLAPDNYLTSATKDVGGEVFKAAQQVANGNFQGGAVNEGMAQNAVGVCDKTFGSLPANIQAAVNKARDDIKSGKVTVPEK